MSSIEKLFIQGIRSFGPDEKDKGLIQFFTPLTLILGPNGTGKTTIIESLKYVTCGEMPPGGKIGGAFVHDPKVAHEREVKGQVRLQFKDCTDKTAIVQRSILASQKAKQVSIKQLDGVITRKRADGTKQSVTSKCVELDNEMVASLGVPKPVLDNVIFCHQEESCWPLSEGKALKQKFDDIFASTRYVKALESIRKFKVDQVSSIKLFNTEINFLRGHKEKAQEIREILCETETKYSVSKDEVKKITETLEPIDEQLYTINEKANEIYLVQTSIEKLLSEKEQMDRTATKLLENIKDSYQGSTESLKQDLSEFQEKVDEKQAMYVELQDKLDNVTNQLEKYRKQKSNLLVEQGKLDQEAERHTTCMTRRDKRVKELAEDYNLEGFSYSQNMSDTDIKEFNDLITEKIEEAMTQAHAVKGRYEEKESDLQQRMDEVRDTKTKLEQSETMKKDQLKKNVAEIKIIAKQLGKVDASAGRLDELGRGLKREERELKELDGSLNVDNLRAEIQTIQKNKKTYEARVTVLSEEQTRISSQASARAQLEMLEKDRNNKQDMIHQTRTKHDESLIHLLDRVPAENVSKLLEQYIGKQNVLVQKMNSEIQQKHGAISTKEANKKHLMEQIRKKEDELGEYNSKVEEVCGSQQFQMAFETIKKQLDDSQTNKALFTGTESVYKSFLRRVLSQREDGPEDTKCPLCKRNFQTEDDVDVLVDEMETKLRMAPKKLEKYTNDVSTNQQRYDELLQLQPLMEQIKVIEEQDIPGLRRKMKATSNELEKLKESKEELDEEMDMKNGDLSLAKSIHPEIILMDQYTSELKELRKKIDSQSSKLDKGGSGKSLSEVNNEKEEVQIKLDTTNKNLEHRRKMIEEHTERLNELKTNINHTREEKLQLESDLAKRCKLEETKAELTSANQTFEREMKDSREQMRPLEKQWDNLKDEKKKLTRQKESKFDEMKEAATKIDGEKKAVNSLQHEIVSYFKRGRDKAIGEGKKKITEFQSKMEKIEKEKEIFEKKCSKMFQDIALQREKERDLDDNLQYRQKQEESSTTERKIAEAKKKLGGFEATSMNKERKKLVQKRQTLEKEKSVKEGRQTGLEEEIRRFRKELNTDTYKDAEEKYRNKMIELKTTEIANKDLDKYYKALDRAIMQYHKVKMDEINKIIKELWRETYRGHDIENIEIRSDQDEDGLSKTRRNYNYRVVMVKPQATLDMRGRCSAGQKVLASLIIRLALAETFCINCGILALDEPTTNLDRENIESLAFSLVEIIKARIKQRNFQLIVITHDEDFVELLGRSEYVEEFYKINKTIEGLSTITKAKVSDLGMHTR